MAAIRLSKNVSTYMGTKKSPAYSHTKVVDCGNDRIALHNFVLAATASETFTDVKNAIDLTATGEFEVTLKKGVEQLTLTVQQLQLVGSFDEIVIRNTGVKDVAFSLLFS